VASLQKKENAGTARREMGFKVTPRRNVLSAINNGGANGGAPSAPADGGGGAEAAPVVEFSGREDVERLLAEKMKGKSKNDYKVGFEGEFYWCVLASDLEAFS
jgi:kinesin family protein C1